MKPAERGARPRAPISLQLVALLLASLLAAQAFSFLVLLFIPPPRPPVYHMAEVAAALRGGSLHTRLGRPLTRTVVRSLPPEFNREHGRAVWALAEALGAPQARVRLAPQNPSPAMLALHRARRRVEGAPDHPMGPPPDFGRGGGGFDHALHGDFGRGPPPNDGWRRFGATPAALPIVGDFSAALQQDDGGWVVVRPTPEPFPNTWQIETSLWLFAGFLIVAPAGYLFARRITAPLKRFACAAETLGRDPHAPLMTLTGPAEIGAAAAAFNEMQARIKAYVQDRTAMMGAISHDLRTPLARIRFKMESAPALLKDAVLSDVAQMEQMIAGVLAFIRNESQPRRREKLDLLSLVECVADDAALLGGDVEIEAGEPVTVDGDPVALQRLFSNLVDNALKYGGEARIRVAREDATAVVRIADGGAGLSPAELEQVFQPFYRTDRSRNLDNGGVGLGLPIARSAARAHGGDVQLACADKGVTAVVTLPVA